MQPLRPRTPPESSRAGLLFSALAVVAGCASPGPPRPPSLGLPEAVRPLAAERVGGSVHLRFTVPSRSTDDQQLRAATLTGSLCRQVGSSGPCVPVDQAETGKPLAVPGPGPAPEVLWTDALSPELAAGSVRLLSYRVVFRNANGRPGQASDPAFALAGDVPPPVADFSAQGTRAGVLLRWAPRTDAGEVLIQRTTTAATAVPKAPNGIRSAGSSVPIAGTRKPRADPGPATVWLQAQPGNTSAGQTMDGAAEEGAQYRYLAVRRRTVTLGGRTLELRSAPSSPVEIAWRNVYPPPAPTGLTAVGFTTSAAASTQEQTTSAPARATSAPAGYAIDLIWQPVDDARLAGYLVYRQRLDRAGQPVGSRVRLTPAPIATPSLHDPSALAGARYRFGVTAIDPSGNESAPAETTIEPTAAPVTGP